ncbi:MAG: hypothetical protein AAGD96_25050, partial [Chloroflexota bacterium]
YCQMLSEPAVANEDLTYLETEKILNRFEQIFTTEHTRLAAKPIDYLKWSVRTNWRSLKKKLRIS